MNDLLTVKEEDSNVIKKDAKESYRKSVRATPDDYTRETVNGKGKSQSGQVNELGWVSYDKNDGSETNESTHPMVKEHTSQIHKNLVKGTFTEQLKSNGVVKTSQAEAFEQKTWGTDSRGKKSVIKSVAGVIDRELERGHDNVDDDLSEKSRTTAIRYGYKAGKYSVKGTISFGRGAVNLTRYGIKLSKDVSAGVFTAKTARKAFLTRTGKSIIGTMPSVGKLIKKEAKDVYENFHGGDDFGSQVIEKPKNLIVHTKRSIKMAHTTGKAIKRTVRMTKSVISKSYNSVKTLMKIGRELLKNPLTIKLAGIGIGVVFAIMMITLPVSFIGAVFGQSFSTSDSATTWDIREYLTQSNMIPAWRTAYIQSLASKCAGYLGTYDSVVLYTNADNGTPIDCSYDSISNVFYSEDDLVNIIQPIFNALLLKDYDLEPNSTDAQALAKKLFDQLFTVTISVSYQSSGKDENGNTVGSSTMTVTLSMDGIYKLLDTYFTQPIDQLSNLTSRTSEQETELQNLKDYYEITQEYISEVSDVYSGSGMSMDDISNANLITGDRNGDQAITTLALAQVGQAGGQPYWSWEGYGNRVSWCACFVSYIYAHTGHSDVNYTSCTNGVAWFKSHGRWAPKGYKDLAPGDVIFIDWQADGKVDHTGIVIGTDGTNVYTVEGNRSDKCIYWHYSLNSSVIFGYGLLP
jgi:hypothetical protein